MIPRNRPGNHQQEEEEYFNPARRHLKKPQKKQLNPTPSSSIYVNTELQHRFRDASDYEKQGWYSELRENNLPLFPPKDNKNAVLEFSSIRRKLRFQQQNLTLTKRSSSKSLTFSDVIRMSRQKKQRQQSRAKASIQMKTSIKALNKLKNRLLGQNNINKSNIIKPAIEKSYDRGVKERKEDEIDMVRVSIDFTGENLEKSLDMSPMFT